MMHLHKEFDSKGFETRCWNEAAKYWNNLSKGTTAENLDQGEAEREEWELVADLLIFSIVFFTNFSKAKNRDKLSIKNEVN